jgi:hypothetical protein
MSLTVQLTKSQEPELSLYPLPTDESISEKPRWQGFRWPGPPYAIYEEVRGAEQSAGLRD